MFVLYILVILANYTILFKNCLNNKNCKNFVKIKQVFLFITYIQKSVVYAVLYKEMFYNHPEAIFASSLSLAERGSFALGVVAVVCDLGFRGFFVESDGATSLAALGSMGVAAAAVMSWLSTSGSGGKGSRFPSLRDVWSEREDLYLA